MRVDFYHLTRYPAPQAVSEIAEKALARGQRMLVVSGDDEQCAAISDALWQARGFLAHGQAGGEADAHQPLLIAQSPVQPANGARIVAFADGRWHDEAAQFERALLFFDESAIEGARECWRTLKTQQGCEQHYWKQTDAGWREGP